VTFELAGIGLVIAATVALGSSVPPRALAEVADQSTAIMASDTQGELTAQVELRPGTTGGTTMEVRIEGVSGEPADEIAVTAELPSESLGPIEVPVEPDGDNAVSTTDAEFPVAGTWTITVTARFGEFDQVVFKLDVPVAQR
jgi:copper transport protein